MKLTKTFRSIKLAEKLAKKNNVPIVSNLSVVYDSLKSDEINQLHRKKSPDLYQAWLDYNYNGTHPEPSGNRNHRPTEYRPPISFEEYVSMKKERRRRANISETLTAKSDFKELGLSKEQIERLIQLMKERRT